MIRRLYDWVLHWAETPYGVPALFLLAFAESSFFPVPPDVLLIALAISIPARAFRFAFVCSLGSVLGGILGYSIGFEFYDLIGKPIIEFYHGQEKFEEIRQLYDQYGTWAVFIAGLTPIPYKVFTIASGVFNFKFVTFMLASIVSRSLRFFAVSALIWFFGPKIKHFIDKYFNLLVMAFTIALIGGFVLLKYVF
ncbi:cytochrome B [candidate division KSB3 bacterium]|uniref:Cytochrome B n=1 Tax=candidate division KSB3 bacterium TaxID=2044937 RepID=A0A2G6KEZ7_9BACT|nr:MAG: cytochrome B [candidate division KSB3 bacterium]